jgi:hypothetical protein
MQRSDGVELSSETLSPPCPHCAEGVGEVVAVEVGGIRGRLLTYNCKGCGGSWERELPANVPPLVPKT